jgi:DNA modification methylase
MRTPNEQGRYPSNVLGDIADYQKYFYCPRCQPPREQERHRGFEQDKDVGNNHPTVKPVALMKYLVQLVTPQGSHVIDPFSGSGSTGMACRELGRTYTGIDLDPRYCEIARKRIAATQPKTCQRRCLSRSHV